jgi:antitoxin FitA
MGQLVVRNIENVVKERLQRRARRNRRSMEEEVREILRNAVNRDDEGSARGLGSELAGLFAKTGLDSDIPELRGNPIKPASFEP